MATMSPEEVLLAGMQPIQRAVDNFAQGQTDMARLQFATAAQRAGSAESFTRQAQEAREMFALQTAAQRALAQERDKYISDREDSRQEAMDTRQDKSLKAHEDRAVAAEKSRISAISAEEKQRTIRELITKYRITIARQSGQDDDDYLMTLLEAKAKKDESDATNAATTILALNGEVERLLNPGGDPSKSAYINSRMAVSVPGLFIEHLEKQNPKLSAKLQKEVSGGLPLEQVANAHGLGSLLTNFKNVVRGQVAQELATDEEKIRLRQLGDTIAQIQQSNPEVARRVGEAMAKHLSKPAQPTGNRPPIRPPQGGAPIIFPTAPTMSPRVVDPAAMFQGNMRGVPAPVVAPRAVVPADFWNPAAQSPTPAFATPQQKMFPVPMSSVITLQ